MKDETEEIRRDMIESGHVEEAAELAELRHAPRLYFDWQPDEVKR